MTMMMIRGQRGGGGDVSASANGSQRASGWPNRTPIIIQFKFRWPIDNMRILSRGGRVIIGFL